MGALKEAEFTKYNIKKKRFDLNFISKIHVFFHNDANDLKFILVNFIKIERFKNKIFK